MGIIRRQSMWATVAAFAGGVLGYVNKVYLFTEYLTVQQVGFANMLLEVAGLFGMLAMLGLGSTTLKYFPFFQDKEKKHHNFLLFILGVLFVGMLISIGIMLYSKPLIVRWKENDTLLLNYFSYLVPMVMGYAFFNAFYFYLRSQYNLAVPAVVKEVVLRLSVTVAIVVFWYQLVDFDGFVFWYSLAPVAMAVSLILYTIYKGELYLIPGPWDRVRQYASEMLRHGRYVLLGGLSFIIVLKMDIIMIFGELDEAKVGIYTTVAYFTIVMEFPFRALSNTASPRIAEMWKENDIAGINRFFKRTSLLNFIVGILLFCGIWINLDTIFSVMRNPAYATGRNVFLILGFSRVLHMLMGFNQQILATSRAFRYDLLFNVGLLIIAFVLNSILIPIYGINGAAIATGVSMLLYNVSRVLFLYRLDRLHPFSSKLIWVTLIAIGAMLVNEVLPVLDHKFLDLLYRSALFTLMFMGPILLLRLSDDLEALVNMLWEKVREILKLK